MKRNGSDDDSVLSPDVDPTARARPADAGAQQPDLAKTGLAFESRRGRPVDLTVLSVLAVLYTLYFAREFLLPIVFALLLSFLFSPVARWFALMLAKIVRPFQRASKTAEQMAAAAAATGTDASPKKPAEVVVQGPSLASRVFGTTQAVGCQRARGIDSSLLPSGGGRSLSSDIDQGSSALSCVHRVIGSGSRATKHSA